MEHVEILRSRRILIRWTVVVGCIFLIWTVALAGHGVRIDGGKLPSIPLVAVLTAVAFCSFILASIVAPGLNNEASTIAITWTRPVSRASVAWRYVGVDLVTIAIGSVLLAAAVLALLAISGMVRYVRFDLTPLDALELAGCIVMWYGLCLVAAARVPERAGMIAGTSWGVFVVLSILASVPFPALIHDIVVGLNYLNPLAYISQSEKGMMLAGNLLAKTAAIWAIGIVSLVAAVRLWSTREA